MTARQTVIAVRSDQTYLSTEVASLLPSEIGKARTSVRRSQSRRSKSRIKTTFCPICGGDKGKDAARCANCRGDAMRANQAAGGTRRGGAGRHLVGDAMRRTDPGLPSRLEPRPEPVAWGRRTHGLGRDHRQEWKRMVRTEDGWIEQETPEAIEWKEATLDAVTRLTAWRMRNER